jgi:hypothetical protein
MLKEGMQINRTCKTCKLTFDKNQFASWFNNNGSKCWKTSCPKCDYQNRKGYLKDYRSKLKYKIWDLLGDRCCNRCGLADEYFLEIDHIIEVTVSDKKRLDYSQLWALMKRNPEVVKEYQLLCMACNVLKEAERLRSIQNGDSE